MNSYCYYYINGHAPTFFKASNDTKAINSVMRRAFINLKPISAIYRENSPIGWTRIWKVGEKYAS